MDEPITTIPENKTSDTAPAPVAAPVEAPASVPQRPERQTRFQSRMSAGRQGRRGMGGGRQGRGRSMRPQEKPEFDSKPIDIARVTRVTKGGKRFSFRTTVVIGDGKGRVGVGMAKGRDVAQSIQKATAQARKHLIRVPVVNGTIAYQVDAKFHSAVVILKPSKRGVKAGGPVRVVARMAGIHNVTGKLIERTNNKINIAMATIAALKKLPAA